MSANFAQTVLSLDQLVFTTREVAERNKTSVASASQGLARLAKSGLLTRVLRNVWAKTTDKRLSAYDIIPYLNPKHRAYLSFISALNLYGVISQIPQVITVASTAHSQMVKTTLGTFHVHQLSPDFFDGFDWAAGHGYLVATPEKALVDCLYLSCHKKRQFKHFPEMDLSALKKKNLQKWVNLIKDKRIRMLVQKRVSELLRNI